MGRPTASIVTVSHGDEHHSFAGGVNGEPFVVDGPGEYEIADVLISGVRTGKPIMAGSNGANGAPHKRNTAYVMEVDGLRICHLGDLSETLSDEQIEHLGTVDVAMVPVGGGHVIGPTKAAEVVSQLEPNLVIPMHYRIAGTKSEELEPVERFMREMGSKSVEAVPKVSLGAKGGLPTDMQVVVMEHKR